MNNIFEHLSAIDPYMEDCEGVIITMQDGQMIKKKFSWYIELHGLIGPDAFRENLLIQSIVGGSIDDVIAQLQPGPKKDTVIKLEELVSRKFNHMVVEFKELRRKFFQDFGEDRKKFAIKHRKDPMFGPVMKTISTSFRDIESTAEKLVKETIIKRTNSLTKAKDFIDSIDSTSHLSITDE